VFSAQLVTDVFKLAYCPTATDCARYVYIFGYQLKFTIFHKWNHKHHNKRSDQLLLLSDIAWRSIEHSNFDTYMQMI